MSTVLGGAAARYFSATKTIVLPRSRTERTSGRTWSKPPMR